MGRLTRWIAVLGWLVAGFAAGPALAQELTASVDRETIFAGETVRLTLEYRGDATGLAPDFAPLRAGFLLGDTASSTQINFVNGQRDIRTQWSVELEPRREGTIVIPPLGVGTQESQPITLTVLPRGQDTEGEDLFVELEVDDATPYVHGQVLLTIKLYHVDALTEGRLSEPDLPEAVVERLGEATTYSATIGATRYRVLERRYGVFPERSGEMRIPPVAFRGRVADSRSGFNSIFDRGRRVTASSDAITLDVQPRPAEFSGDDWLPAAAFELNETWPDGGGSFRVGEPVTRRITMNAKGLLAVQLPELTLPEVQGLKIYPDKSQQQSRHDGAAVYGEREQAYAIVPTEAGRLVLPEIRIPWWDTVADRERVAVIPSREVVIQPGAAVPPPQARPLGDVDDASTAGGREATDPRWPIATAVFALLWLVTLLAWLRARRSGPASPAEAPSARVPEATGGDHRRRLKAACRDGDASLAAAALLGWARAESPGAPTNLGRLARRVEDQALAAAIRELDRHLYAGSEGNAPWNGERLAAALQRGLILESPAAANASERQGVLPPLYPQV